MSIDQVYEDLYLPLFGKYSIVGRSVVIHNSQDGGRWVCANIAYPGPITTAIAEFDGFAQGNIGDCERHGFSCVVTSN